MRERKEPDQEGCPLWVVTFGDAMSLLVAFFVMLVSFADFEEHDLQDMMGALKGGLRAVPLPMATAVGLEDSLDEQEGSEDGAAVSATDLDSGQHSQRGKAAKKMVKSDSSDYYLHLLKSGITLVIKQDAVFKSGTATLLEPTHEAWQVASDLLHTIESEIRIVITLPENALVRQQGCTTPWGLGIERALAVEEFLIEKGGNRKTMSASIRVVKTMPLDEAAEGTVEIHFIGVTELKLKTMPGKILRGAWRERDVIEEEELHEEEG